MISNQRQRSYPGVSPHKVINTGRVVRGQDMSNSYSPGRRRQSPAKDNSLEEKTLEDMKSLRLQLISLKKQLNAQEADNMTLIEKVT